MQDRHRVIQHLIQSKKIDLLKKFVQKNKGLATFAVESLGNARKPQDASAIIDANNLNPSHFPKVLEGLTFNTMFFHVRDASFGLLYIYELLRDKPDHLEVLISVLLKQKKESWAIPFAAQIFNETYGLRLSRNLTGLMKNTKLRRSQGLPNRFQPCDPYHYLQIQLPREAVMFITTDAQLESVDLSGEVIGLDCEWKAPLRKYDASNVALMQIGFHNRVYLIDLISLNSNPLLDNLLLSVFTSEVPKIGVSFKGDLSHLARSYPHMRTFQQKMNNLFDLCEVYQARFGHKPGGLAGVCELVLGKELCKCEQCSNWENRPLREAQVHYAALDAHIQLVVVDAMCEGRPYLEFLQAPGKADTFSDTQLVKCKGCKSVRHTVSDCARGKPCKLCKQFGHDTAVCPF